MRWKPDISEVYPQDKADDERGGEWFSYLVYRRISLWLMPCLLRVSVSAGTVSWLNLLLVAVLPGFAHLASPFGYVSVACVSVLIGILDCVDGNLARATRTVSAWGHYLDTITGVLFRISLYLSLGLLIARDGPSTDVVSRHSVAFALGAALLAITARLSRTYAEQSCSDDSDQAESAGASALVWRWYDGTFLVVSGLDNLTPLLILCLGITGQLDLVLWWLVLYSLADFSHTQIAVWLRLR